MRVATNCTIDIDLKNRAKINNLDFSECLTFGILFKLAEMSDLNYPPNKLNQKIKKMAERLQELAERLEKEEYEARISL